MALFWLSVATLFAGALSVDDSCPSPAEISPCTCDGEGFNCMGARTLEEIKRAFSAKFKYGGVRSVWVQGTPIQSIPADLFGEVKTQQFYIEVNEITTVNVKAFHASKDTLHTLSLFGNKIKEFPFGDLNMYENLATLNLGRNYIETIPANAFNSKYLYAIILAQNRITQIGMNAFNGLPNLGRLEISSNSISELGPMSFAMQKHSQGLQINLSGNKISEVSPTAFTGLDPYALFLSSNQLTSLKKDPFAVLITQIAQKGGFIEVSGNPFTCKGCDYSWLVLNKDLLDNKLIGFTCRDRRSLQELTEANIGCP